MVVFCQTKPAT